MIRIPYGISNYEKLINDGCHYVDRTHYIALLEKLGESYLFFCLLYTSDAADE